MCALLATEACELEVGCELGGVACRPRMGLDEDLVHALPRLERRAEDRGALGALDVDLHDHAASGREQGRFVEGVRERDHLHLLSAHLVLGERRRRGEGMAPRGAHHVQLGPARRRVDGSSSDRPFRPWMCDCGSLEDGEIRRLGLVSDNRERTVGRGVRRGIPFVGSDVDDHRARVVGGIGLLDYGEVERLAVDDVIVVRQVDGAKAVSHPVQVAPHHLPAEVGNEQVQSGSQRQPAIEERLHRSPRLTSRPMDARAVPRSARRLARTTSERLRTALDLRASRRDRADLAVFHDFEPAPAGGGHQFLRGLVRELEGRGLVVEVNRISGSTPACLFNSFNFDLVRLRRFARADCRMVHRVDGPVGVYRGFDDGTDRRIGSMNAELADATVVQSRYSLDKHRELGLRLVEPVVIENAVDARIFHPPAERVPLDGRRVRVIASSWSDNERKGADTLAWLDENLDHVRYELTFVGRMPRGFEHIAVVGPVDTHEVARLLREHDVYLAASRDDPCSNALLEALACGLPAVFRSSGGHPELVGAGGVRFDADDEIPAALDRLVAELDRRRSAIPLRALSEVADRYLDVLGLAPDSPA
jgi:glycosyltransferase involved in cell wall biosynthesis